MLYNQHLEPISTEVTVGTLSLSTPPYTPHKNPHSHTPFAPARPRSKSSIVNVTGDHYYRVQNGSPGSTRFYGSVHLRRHWSVQVSNGPYILGRPVKFVNSRVAEDLHTIRKRMPRPFQ